MTCKTAKKGKGKELWSRKVESPVAEAKREASRELLTLIQGKNSTIQDKENASKHLLALIHGSKKKSKSSPAHSRPNPNRIQSKCKLDPNPNSPPIEEPI